MDSPNTVCPVCTLYLRPGITLKSHLNSHPKQKVIEALVKLSNPGVPKIENVAAQCDNSPQSSSQVNTAIVNQSWNQQSPLPNPANITTPMQGNHLFIYQQSMSTTSPQPNVLNINPLTQQYVIPTVFNPQMMPYVYQQQQVIMSSNSCVPPSPSALRALPFELPTQQTPEMEEPMIQESEPEPVDQNVVNEGASTSNYTPEINAIDYSEMPLKECKQPQKDEVIVFVKADHKSASEETLENLKPTEGDENEYEDQYEDYDSSFDNECLGSPNSTAGSDWSLRVRSDLNKACQTQSNNQNSPCSIHEEVVEEVEAADIEEDQPDYYYVSGNQTPPPYTTINLNTNNYEQTQPVYSTSNMLQSNEHIDFVDMEGMHVIINDISSNHIIAQVENFENARPERSGVLMTIGEMVIPTKDDFNDQRDMDESMSRESSNVNIRTDERMPARGELSGQESLGGASDITWNRIQYHESSSRMSTSYDLMARESWEASDSSDVEVPPLQSRLPSHIDYPKAECDNDTPTVIGYTGPPLNFKCSTCDEAFSCLKDRKEHEHEKHPEKFKKSNIIGSDIGKKKIKKLVIKTKVEKPETENNFDNVFTNKLKLETTLDIADKTGEVPTLENVKVDEVPVDIKSVCSICDSVLENAKALRIHKVEVHKVSADIRHKCATCGLTFPHEYKFTEHLKIHPLECRICGKLFYRKQNIQLHMKRHLGLKPYKCEICEKTFVTKQKHDEHKNTHTGDAPIKCTLCDETFRRHSNLVQHRNRHHFNMKKKVKDYICYCGEIFHSKKKLAWHKEIHDAKPKSCTQCSEKFIHMSSLTRHMRRAHNAMFLPKEERSSENAECPVCKKVYLKTSLDVHIRNHSGQRPYTCLICNKDFTTKWNLKLHKWTHASRTSKPFKCDQCKGAFIRESDYVAHMNSHKSVRPYTCNYCGAQFIRKYNCQRHVKEHENGKTFNCQVCGKSFHRSYYLKDHMRVHSGIRPYACHICGKTSTTKSNHNKHVQIHHAREPVSTEN